MVVSVVRQRRKSDVLDMRALGEAAVWLDAGGGQDPVIQRRLLELAAEVAQWHGVDDVVPGMNNATVFFQPDLFNAPLLEQRLRQAWADTARLVAASQSYGLFRPGRTVEIPVMYGGEHGPDLEALAAQLGKTAQQIIALHTGVEYQVFFLGFQPGFPYLAGLPPELAAPRRSEPRKLVPSGSVGIGGHQTGIYPNASPGGWHLIGRTSTLLFDSTRAAPALLKAGDRVRFVAEAT